MNKQFKGVPLDDKIRNKIIRSFSDQAIAKGKEAEIKENEELEIRSICEATGQHPAAVRVAIYDAKQEIKDKARERKELMEKISRWICWISIVGLVGVAGISIPLSKEIKKIELIELQQTEEARRKIRSRKEIDRAKYCLALSREVTRRLKHRQS